MEHAPLNLAGLHALYKTKEVKKENANLAEGFKEAKQVEKEVIKESLAFPFKKSELTSEEHSK